MAPYQGGAAERAWAFPELHKSCRMLWSKSIRPRSLSRSGSCGTVTPEPLYARHESDDRATVTGASTSRPLLAVAIACAVPVRLPCRYTRARASPSRQASVTRILRRHTISVFASGPGQIEPSIDISRPPLRPELHNSYRALSRPPVMLKISHSRGAH